MPDPTLEERPLGATERPVVPAVLGRATIVARKDDERVVVVPGLTQRDLRKPMVNLIFFIDILWSRDVFRTQHLRVLGHKPTSRITIVGAILKRLNRAV